MKKKLFVILLTMTMAAASLAGCGSSDKKSEETTKTEETKEDAKAETSENADAPHSDTGSAAAAVEELSDGLTSSDEATQAEIGTGTAELPEEETEAGEEKKAAEEAAPAEETKLDVSQPLTGIHHAALEIEDYGTISLELDADTAPISVTNFVKLAQEGFYDGLTFHRIISGFMMQGGDPAGNGTGGSDETIKGEFTANGVENNISHKRGVISMARSQDFDSASSQFFIMHQDSPSLDGQYAAFGHVTEGIEIVDKICESAKPINSNGLIDNADRPVIKTITILD